ncbi:radical SAM family heme chaperone HemW [Buchnera aphidicola]|uniref:radical SAM family heme chaperone HemW n=1 Tax=Buchnera aphidicola TaxID=9 RepID=UPI003464415E
MIYIPNKIGLYVHIPWCFKKCPYCDLNAYKMNNYFKQEIYVKKIIQDLLQDKHFIHQRTIKSIFIGGGTPNLLHQKLLKMILVNIKNLVSVDQNAEVTIEVHPKFVNIKNILKYVKIGINRISFGIQTFDKNLSQLIGRSNTTEHIISLLNQVKKIIPINFNIDLMYGLPNQTVEDCLLDLKTAIQMNPNHISWYQMNVEKNTIFYYQKPSIPKENIILDMYKKGNRLLKQSKYKQYEISSYAKKKYFCYHNLNYWKYGDYLGIGCGAHSKLTQKKNNIIRIIKKKRIHDYYHSNNYIEKIYSVKERDQPFEYFMNIFRILQPIKKKSFLKKTNISIPYIQKSIQTAIKKKYIIQKKKSWRILPKGKIFFNDLIELFLYQKNNTS